MAVDELGNVIPEDAVVPESQNVPPPLPEGEAGDIRAVSYEPTALEQTNLDIGTASDVTQSDIGVLSAGTKSTYAGAGTEDDTAGAIAQRESEIQEGADFFDYDKGSVAGLLSSYLDPESQFMKDATLRAKLESQRGGTIGSSMDAGARTAAGYRAAITVAEKDAAAYQRLKEAEQQAYIQAGDLGAGGVVAADLKTLTADLANEQLAFSSKIQTMVKEFDYKGSNISQEFLQGTAADHELNINQAMADSELAIQTALQQQTIDANAATAVRNNIASTVQNYQIQMETLLSNESFTSLSTEAQLAVFDILKDQTIGITEFFAKGTDFDYEGYTKQLDHDLTVGASGYGEEEEEVVEQAPIEPVTPAGYAPEQEAIDDAGNFSIALPDLDTDNIASATIHWGDRKTTEVEDLEDLKTGVDYTYQSGAEGTDARVIYTMTNGEEVTETFNTTEGISETPEEPKYTGGDAYIQDPDTGDWRIRTAEDPAPGTDPEGYIRDPDTGDLRKRTWEDAYVQDPDTGQWLIKAPDGTAEPAKQPEGYVQDPDTGEWSISAPAGVLTPIPSATTTDSGVEITGNITPVADYDPGVQTAVDGNLSFVLPDLDVSNVQSAKIYWGDRSSTEVTNLSDLTSGIDNTYKKTGTDYKVRVSYTMKDGTLMNKWYDIKA